jgi:hypothetical protein
MPALLAKPSLSASKATRFFHFEKLQPRVAAIRHFNKLELIDSHAWQIESMDYTLWRFVGDLHPQLQT